MNTKKIVAMLALSLLLGGGVVGITQVAAQTYAGSITVDDTKYEGLSEQEESKALVGLAEITADEAEQVAEAKVGGTASKVELGNENGTLIYEVEIGNQEVKVDAGNGSVLQVENDNNEKENIEEVKKDGDIEKDGIDH